MPIYGDFIRGIRESKKIQNGFDDLQNCDVHSELGSLMCQKSLEKASSTTVTAGCYIAIDPAGTAYFFSKTDGKIWKRTTLGAYSLVRTNPNGAHKSARYYNGYIYYTTNDKLGRFDLSTTWTDSFQNLTASYPHPMKVLDLILYIGNQKDVAQLDDAGVYSTSGLDLPPQFHVTALEDLGDDLLTLANPGDYINDSAIFRWNTYSSSWSIKDSFFETNAYAFLNADNYKYVIAQTGNVYFYNGNQLETFSTIRNAETTTGHQLTTNLQGKPLIANGGVIYSLHRKNRDMPIALVGEYTCSAGADSTIHSIEAIGSNLLVSWENDGTFGIDEISSNYETAVVTTPRFRKNGIVKVYYDDLNGGEISIKSKVDGASAWSAHTVIDDSDDKRMVRTVDDLIVDSGAQVQVTITPDTEDPTSTPVIDLIEISNG